MQVGVGFDVAEAMQWAGSEEKWGETGAWKMESGSSSSSRKKGAKHTHTHIQRRREREREERDRWMDGYVDDEMDGWMRGLDGMITGLLQCPIELACPL